MPQGCGRSRQSGLGRVLLCRQAAGSGTCGSLLSVVQIATTTSCPAVLFALPLPAPLADAALRHRLDQSTSSPSPPQCTALRLQQHWRHVVYRSQRAQLGNEYKTNGSERQKNAEETIRREAGQNESGSGRRVKLAPHEWFHGSIELVPVVQLVAPHSCLACQTGGSASRWDGMWQQGAWLGIARGSTAWVYLWQRPAAMPLCAAPL